MDWGLKFIEPLGQVGPPSLGLLPWASLHLPQSHRGCVRELEELRMLKNMYKSLKDTILDIEKEQWTTTIEKSA